MESVKWYGNSDGRKIFKKWTSGIKNKMNAKALAKRRSKTTLRLAANIIFTDPYTASAFIRGQHCADAINELFTTDLNLFPKHPTPAELQGEAFTTVPLLRFILNSFIMAGCITIGQIISCSLAAFAFPSWNLREKEILLQLLWQPWWFLAKQRSFQLSDRRKLGILDTYAVLIIPYLTSAMGIFCSVSSIWHFPMSLYESAKLDGCSNLEIHY